MIEMIAFYVFGGLLLLSAIMVVTSPNIFHAAVALTATLSVTAALFVLLGADFLAAGQLLVYVGGIMVIMLFVVMFSQRAQDSATRQTLGRWPWALIVSGTVAGAFILRFGDHFIGAGRELGLSATSARLGELLLGDMRIPFEAVSLVLLAALVGAIVFADKGSETSK